MISKKVITCLVVDTMELAQGRSVTNGATPSSFTVVYLKCSSRTPDTACTWELATITVLGRPGPAGY